MKVMHLELFPAWVQSRLYTSTPANAEHVIEVLRGLTAQLRGEQPLLLCFRSGVLAIASVICQ